MGLDFDVEQIFPSVFIVGDGESDVLGFEWSWKKIEQRFCFLSKKILPRIADGIDSFWYPWEIFIDDVNWFDGLRLYGEGYADDG